MLPNCQFTLSRIWRGLWLIERLRVCAFSVTNAASRKTTLPFELYNGESFEKISVMQVLLTGLVHSQLICDMEWT